MSAVKLKPEVTNLFSAIPGKEVKIEPSELIVSKTDTRGIIRYANDTFCRVSGFPEKRLIGSPHSLVRHSLMPAAIFRYMWERIQSGRETFAYVINRTASNNYYWVFAHVTPSFDENDRITGYHSSRRRVNDEALPYITSLYSALLDIENQAPARQSGIQESMDYLYAYLKKRDIDYEEFALSLCTF